MKLASNIGRAVNRADGKSGGGGVRGANKVVKFGLFCNKVEQSSYKARC